jgi:hypothetical protein
LAGLPDGEMVWVTGHELRGRRTSTLWVRAQDAGSAERAVEEALPGLPAVESAGPLLYSVTVEVPAEDVRALEEALTARRRDTGKIGPLITPASDDAPAELLLDVDADTDDQAIHLAGQHYDELRREAQLLPAVPRFRWLYPPWPAQQRPAQPPRHQVLLGRAWRLLLREENFDGAVVTAQSAVEVLVVSQLGQRLQREPIGELRGYILTGVRKHNLNDESTQRLWQVLTGDRINQADPWREYKLHLDRRNDIVHRGAEITRADAESSVAIAEAMIRHIESIPFRPRGAK